MAKRKIALALTGLFAICGLAGCKTEEAAATYEDMTALSIFGQLSNFEVDSLKAGHTLTFTATPSDYYTVAQATNNNVPCERVRENEDGSVVFQTKLKAGENRLVGTYDIDPTVDIVEKYKMPVSDAIFNTVLNYSEHGVKTGLDFRKSGIEKMQAPNEFKNDGTKKESKAFINYVDGDTTHSETFNLGYTVKMRYLSINTPESTSEIEEWGLTASNYNKFVYTGNADYLADIYDHEALAERPNGVTSLILLSEAMAKHETLPEDEEEPEVREPTVADLMIGDTSGKNGPFHATTDGYQRNLCYVWYATVQNPTKDDFRCLNLEMVYQGLSLGIGSRESTSLETYKMFAAADNSAKANRRHIHSGRTDANYFYYNRTDEQYQIQRMPLKTLYRSALLPNGSDADPDIKYDPSISLYADKRTLWRIEGYVTQKVGSAFYIQDNYEYDNDKVVNGTVTPYGIYVFTLREMPIRIGDYVSVVGAISTYGGTFQIQGVSYHESPDYKRDTLIGYSYNDLTGEKTPMQRKTIVPIKLTGAQFNALRLPSVLVEIVENIWFYDFQEKFSGQYQSLAEGGSEEVNKYNEYYKFYNTSNNPYVWASYGATDNAAQLNIEKRDDGLRYSPLTIRFVVNDEILLSSGGEYCYSYHFLTGGTYYYNEYGAEYANLDEDNPYREYTITKTMTRKALKYEDGGDGYGVHGAIIVSHAYESTSGKRKMTAEICSSALKQIRFSSVS